MTAAFLLAGAVLPEADEILGRSDDPLDELDREVGEPLHVCTSDGRFLVALLFEQIGEGGAEVEAEVVVPLAALLHLREELRQGHRDLLPVAAELLRDLLGQAVEAVLGESAFEAGVRFLDRADRLVHAVAGAVMGLFTKAWPASFRRHEERARVGAVGRGQIEERGAPVVGPPRIVRAPSL